jgi:curved DNA-binding protein CbpA
MKAEYDDQGLRVLGVSDWAAFGELARAGEKEIRRAYHKKALLLHPDKLAEKSEQVREETSLWSVVGDLA